MWCRSYIRQLEGVTQLAGSPEVKAQGGPEQQLPGSDQPRGQATRRAVAKANGLALENSSRAKLICGFVGDAKDFRRLSDGQCRCRSNGNKHASGLPGETEGGNPGESERESPEGLATGQEDP